MLIIPKLIDFCHSYFCYFLVSLRGILTESNSTCFVTNITTLGWNSSSYALQFNSIHFVFFCQSLTGGTHYPFKIQSMSWFFVCKGFPFIVVMTRVGVDSFFSLNSINRLQFIYCVNSHKLCFAPTLFIMDKH